MVEEAVVLAQGLWRRQRWRSDCSDGDVRAGMCQRSYCCCGVDAVIVVLVLVGAVIVVGALVGAVIVAVALVVAVIVVAASVQ